MMVFLAKGSGATESKAKKPAICNWIVFTSQPMGGGVEIYGFWLSFKTA